MSRRSKIGVHRGRGLIADGDVFASFVLRVCSALEYALIAECLDPAERGRRRDRRGDAQAAGRDLAALQAG